MTPRVRFLGFGKEHRNDLRGPRLNDLVNEHISPLVSIHKLFAVLVALAVLFAPNVTLAGQASASVPDHHAQMMEKGHCDPSDSDNERSIDMACCEAMCMAVTATFATVPTARPPHGSAPVASLRSFRAGSPAELATPPPRGA